VDPRVLVSVIIPVRDQPECVRRALESIARHTGSASELVVVDNASGPETRELLCASGARVVRNERNLGCAAAWNQGLRLARGERVCLVNSDVVVPAGWLERLDAFHASHRFAWVSPAVREGPLDYDLEAFNRSVRARFGNRHFPGEFRGMVLFSRRDLYERVGRFDEGYECAKYEDEDMFWRLRRAGLDVAVTAAVVVHHYGSVTIRTERRRSPGFEIRNKAYFDDKWRTQRYRRRRRKLHLAARHLYYRLRHGFTY
jgi:GT2 family glycosyltransferase